MSVPTQAFPLSGELVFVKNPLDNVDLTDGSAYVIDLSATWCPPCRRAFPHLSALQKTYPKIKFMAVSEESESVFKKFANNPNSGLDVAVAVDNCGALDAYRRHFNVSGIPHCFIISKNTVLYSGHPMDPSFEEVLKRVDKEMSFTDFTQLTKQQIQEMKPTELKAALSARGVDYSDCIEKSELLERVYSTLGFKQE